MSEKPPKSNKTPEEIQREIDEAWGQNSASKPNVIIDVEDSATTVDGSMDISATELGDDAEKPEEVLVKSEDNNTLLNMGNPKEIAKFLETAEDREQQISKLIEILENEGSEFSKNGEIISQLNVTNANIEGIENLSVEQFTGLVDRLRSRSENDTHSLNKVIHEYLGSIQGSDTLTPDRSEPLVQDPSEHAQKKNKIPVTTLDSADTTESNQTRPKDKAPTEKTRKVAEHINRFSGAFGRIESMVRTAQKEFVKNGGKRVEFDIQSARRNAMVELGFIDEQDVDQFDSYQIGFIVSAARWENALRRKEEAERAASQNQNGESDDKSSDSEMSNNDSPEAAPEKLTVAEQEARWMESVMDYGAHTYDNERRKRVSEEYAKLQELKEQEKNVDIEALQAEWMRVLGRYGKLMDKSSDKSSPEARELVRKASTLYAEISTAEAAEALKAERADLPDITLPEEATKEYPDLPDIQLPDDVDEPKANGIKTPISDYFRSVQERVKQEALEKERLDQIHEKIATLRGELESDYVYGEGLRQAMSQYAELKADSETKMGDVKIFGLSIWEGRSKREKHLRAADTALLTAKLAFEKELIRRAKEAGLYEGDEAQIAQATSDDLFNALRNLDSETREATNNVLDQRKEERGPIKKTIAAIGNFLTKGKKVTQNVKTIGSGVAVGVIAGVTTTISGIGWPITTALIGGGTALVRGATKMANLDTIRAENKDADGNAYRVMSDEDADAIKRSGAEAGIPSEERAKYVAQMILDRSRERGYEQVDRAQKDANKRAFKFAMGAVAATAATGAVVWSRGAAASALESTDQPDPIDNDIHKDDAEGSEVDDQSLDAPRDLVPDYDFPQGANVITRGEGWVNQYMDMGMSNKEAWALFHDKNLMSELVKLNAAYVDNSANIGGYGINMPENGHLSKAVMEAIGKAKLAKGF